MLGGCNVSKPSIFSRDYKKKMKKRKRRITFICFLLIFLGANVYLYSKLNKNFNIFSLKNYVISIINKKVVNNDKKVVPVVPIKPEKSEIAKNQPTQNVIQEKKEEKSYSFKLSDGKELKAIYEENDGKKKFKNVIGDNENLDFNINPDATGIITYDAGAQSIIFINLDGITSDISKKNYISTSGSEFTKEDTIKNNAGYVWATNPKFIDNENVAYVSQLPWFNQGITKYLWIVNINNPDNPTLFEKVSGANIVLGKLDDKGLNILIDGKTGFLKANGELISS